MENIVHFHLLLQIFTLAMIDTENIHKLADKLSQSLPDSFKTLKGDLDNNLKALLESTLREMNMVSREEFDIQSALLERTQRKLEELEKQLDALQKDNSPHYIIK